MITIVFLVGQILTLISYIVFWISRFVNNKHGILLWDNISRVFAIMGFMIFTWNIVGFLCEAICFFVMFASYRKYNNKGVDTNE